MLLVFGCVVFFCAVMAKQFGENFQYGKRRISAMSNEEFNKLTPKMIQDNANAELKAMIPSMEQSVKEMRVFQTFLIREFLKTLNDAIKAGFGELFGINQDTLSNIEHYLHGHGGGHDTPAPEPEPTPEPFPQGEVPPEIKQKETYSFDKERAQKMTYVQAVNRLYQLIQMVTWRSKMKQFSAIAKWRVAEINAATARYPALFRVANGMVDYKWNLGDKYKVFSLA